MKACIKFGQQTCARGWTRVAADNRVRSRARRIEKVKHKRAWRLQLKQQQDED